MATPPLLRLRYKNAISDAVADLGSADQIRKVFVGFQKFLYEARTDYCSGPVMYEQSRPRL